MAWHCHAASRWVCLRRPPQSTSWSCSFTPPQAWPPYASRCRGGWSSDCTTVAASVDPAARTRPRRSYRRAQRNPPTAWLARHPIGLRRAAPLPARDRLRCWRAGGGVRRRRRPSPPLCRVRRAGDDGILRDERCDLRDLVQLLLQAEIHQALRRRAVDAARRRRYRARRNRLGLAPRHALRVGLHHRHGRTWSRDLPVGAARPPCRHADRLLVRRRWNRGIDVRPHLAGLRPRADRADPNVPLLRDVLSDHRLPWATAGGGAVVAPLSRRRPAAQLDDRHHRP